MGTRNITRVISNGQLKVCQYCQWDGYPTGAGRAVADFIRNSNDEHMIERLEHVTLITNVEGDTFCTGAPIFEEARSIEGDEWDFRPAVLQEFRRLYPNGNAREEYEYIKRRVAELLLEKYGPEVMQRWYISIRNTGNRILSLINESDNELTVYSEDYLTDNFGDWQIEAVWQLDYDKKVLTGWWHEYELVKSFNELREMTDDELDDLMDCFENLGYEED